MPEIPNKLVILQKIHIVPKGMEQIRLRQKRVSFRMMLMEI